MGIESQPGLTVEEVMERLGVSYGRVTWLWLADYIEKRDQLTFDAGSVERYENWRREASRLRKIVRASSTPLRML